MNIRRYIVVCFVLLASLFAVAGFGQQMYCDATNNLYYINSGSILRSNDSGQSWTKITSPVTYEANFQIQQNSDGKLYLFWINDQKLLFSIGDSSGTSFSKPTPILDNFLPDKYSVTLKNGAWQVYYSQNGTVYYSDSMVSNQTVVSRVIDWVVSVSGESKSVYYFTNKSIYRSNNGLNSEVYRTSGSLEGFVDFRYPNIPDSSMPIWIEKDAAGKTHIVLSTMEGSVPISVYETYNDILSAEAKYVNNALLLIYSEQQFDVPIPMLLRVSKDGRSLGNSQKLLDDRYSQDVVLATYLMSNKLDSYISSEGSVIKTEFGNAQPQCEIVLPSDGFKTNQSNIHLKLNSKINDQSDLLYQVKVSWDLGFASDKTWTFDLVSPESNIILPLPDGKYYIKAFASDGISQGMSSIISFVLDRSPLNLNIQNINGNISTSSPTYEIQGTLSKDAFVSINGSLISIDALSTFDANVNLLTGNNNIICLATDEAGNSTFESFSIFYNINAPQISIEKPIKNAYLKQGASILVNAHATDNNRDIADESEADVYIDQNKIMDKLVYNTQDGSLSGFINLPANLSEGNHILSTTISDRMGNAGTSKISFMIDNTPPIVIKRSIMATPKQITLPFVENVSGLDRSAMTFRVFQGSMEVFGKTQVDNSTVIFIPSSGILDGSYTIDYSLRDLVGNSASLESATVTVSSFAADMVSAASDEARITKLECGPSPFNPATSVCYFKYELSEPANVELNIFSFQGSIIFKKSLTPASTADRIIWDGKDCYGNISQAGVYPFVMVIKDDSGRRDIKRGKLIIF